MENSTETKNQSQQQAGAQPAPSQQSASQQTAGAQTHPGAQPAATQPVTLVQSQPQASRQPQQSNVVEIDLVSLMIYCLKHWRAVLITMLVCGILFGGVKGAKTYSEVHAEQIAETETVGTASSDETTEDDAVMDPMQQYENQKATLNRQIASLNQKIEQLNTYMSQSIVYNMDRNQVYRSSLLYYIDTDYEIDPTLTLQPTDKTNSVLKAYVSLIQGERLYEALKDKLSDDTAPEYVRELFKVSADYDNHMLSVSIVGPDADTVKIISDQIKKDITSDQSTVSNLVYPHSIELISDRQYQTTDTIAQKETVQSQGTSSSKRNSSDEPHDIINVAVRQQQVEDTLDSYQQALTDAQTELTNLKEPTSDSSGAVSVKRVAVKYGAIGLILGLVLAGGVLCVQYVLVDRILDRGRIMSRLPKQTPVIILGEYFQAPGHNIFDRWAAACDGRKTGEEDLDNVLSVAKANMLNQGAPGRLLIAGMGNTEAVKAFADTAKDAAESITVQENILTDPAGIKALQNIDTAVLIADKKKARLSNTLAEVTQLQRLGKRVAGIVLV